MEQQVGTFVAKKGLAQMLKGGVIMDVVTPEHARIAEDAGACAVMALELDSVPDDSLVAALRNVPAIQSVTLLDRL